jgi:D-tyrosyl-tRNA(Tyr) deacylase
MYCVISISPLDGRPRAGPSPRRRTGPARIDTSWKNFLRTRSYQPVCWNAAVRAVVQRVTSARVRVDGAVVGEIGPGLCVLVGVTHDDTPAVAARMAAKLAAVRLFGDEEGGMNRSVVEAGGSVLVVSQFTLYGDTTRGRRPSWSAAAPGPVAAPLVGAVVDGLRATGLGVETGVFGAAMVVELVNDGPVTLIVDV